MDKDLDVYNALFAHDFAHAELGTVTPHPQEGNAPPWLERYPSKRAIVNRAGFPNPGLAVGLERVKEFPPERPIGISIGLNKGTRQKEVLDAYAGLANGFAPHTDWITVNVSSPNTPGLRDLQNPKDVPRIVEAVRGGVDEAGESCSVLIKFHPDAATSDLVDTAVSAVDAGVNGIVAVNTSSDLEGFGRSEKGGLSGKPIKEKAEQTIRELYRRVGDDVPLIGVGGIETGHDALRRMMSGASLLQAYTGFIYRGPFFPTAIQNEMLAEMDRIGVDSVQELVGCLAE